MEMVTNKNSSVNPAFILAIGFVIAAWVVSNAFYKVHTLNNTLSVTGSATQNVTADSAKWTISVSRTGTEDAIGSSERHVSGDIQSIVDFLNGGGLNATSTIVNPVAVDLNYSNDNKTAPTYNIHQDVIVHSENVLLIQKLAKNISSLIDKGIIISAQAPEYYVSSLPQLRVSLVGNAIIDAKARAYAIASSTGQSVGALQSASGGVVQVLAPNSVGDVNDYGSYDTSTIDKIVMITAHATFYIK